MGWRFRKSINLGGVRLNFSKKGVGYSVGCKGIRLTKRADGKLYKTFTIPGTGVSYIDPCSQPHNNNFLNLSPEQLDYYQQRGEKVLKFIIKFFLTGGLYMYYAMYKFIKNKIASPQNSLENTTIPQGSVIYPHNRFKD